MPCPTVRDYFALALSIASRRHRPLLARFHDDVLQECRLLAWEAESRRRITVKNGNKRTRYGNGRKVGLKAFSRAVQARLYVMKKNYVGHYTYRKDVRWTRMPSG